MIRNETIESRVISRKWPRVHRLEFKIPNHDDLLSFAQIEILDTDVGHTWAYFSFALLIAFVFPFLRTFFQNKDPHEVRIKTHKDGHEIYIASPAKLRGFASFYHKENSNLYPISKLIPSLFGMLSLDDYYELLPKQT